jgi:hypothetical protein
MVSGTIKRQKGHFVRVENLRCQALTKDKKVILSVWKIQKN